MTKRVRVVLENSFKGSSVCTAAGILVPIPPNLTDLLAVPRGSGVYDLKWTPAKEEKHES